MQTCKLHQDDLIIQRTPYVLSNKEENNPALNWYNSGYLDDDKKTAEAFRDGYYFTGDRAYYDEDGYFWFVGRADDIIISSG